jgi:hypothetical protein
MKNQTMKNLIIMSSESYSLKITGVLIILLISTRACVVAQSGLTVYSDAAKNSVSDGLFIRSAFLGYYKSGNYQLKAGLQTNLVNGNNITLSGYRIDGSREFKTKNTLLELNAFRLWTAYSGILQETNYGCVFSIKTKHFDVQTGTNFRTYSFRRNAFKDYEIGNDATKIHENFNLMYSFGYNLKPSYYRWNAGVALTNIDYFLINQETNPYVNLKGYYKVNAPVCLFAEGWYKNAGVTNISSNYFGFVIRGGIQWNFN